MLRILRASVRGYLSSDPSVAWQPELYAAHLRHVARDEPVDLAYAPFLDLLDQLDEELRLGVVDSFFASYLEAEQRDVPPATSEKLLAERDRVRALVQQRMDGRRTA